MRVGVITSDVSGAVSFYRVLGPLLALARKRTDIEVVQITKVCWTQFSEIDILFMHRCVTKSDLGVMQMAKIAGIPLWIDYDDNFLVIPEDSPAYEAYEDKEAIRENLAKAIDMADVVTCTTDSMRNALMRISEHPYMAIIPNALNTNFVKRVLKPRNKVILWRGSRTHVGDLQSAIDDVRYLCMRLPEHEWIFIGQRPWMFSGISDFKYKYVEGLEPYKYFQLIQGLAPEYMFVPLVDNEFNRAKSNIAWLEGTWAGAKTIASDLPEFRKPGCTVYKPGELPKSDFNADSNTSWDYISGKLTLDLVNSSREHILDTLYQQVK